MRKHIIFLFAVLYFPFILGAQTPACHLEKDSAKARLYHIIEVLSHDSLKGREAGTEEELKAALFIKNLFTDMELTSIFADGAYLQQFNITDGIKLGEDNYLLINNKSYKLLEDYFPINASGNGKLSGEIIRVGWGYVSLNKQYDDYEFFLNDATDKELKGKIFAIEMGIPPLLKNEKINDFMGSIEGKVKLAVEKGAVAVILIKSDNDIIKPSLDMYRFEQAFSIPVIYVDQRAYKTVMDSNNSVAEIAVEIEKNTKTAYNVIAYLDNKAPKTIVIGAHFDHLGYGSPISRYKGGPAIHPGADDNASGVSAMLEVAKHLKCNNFKEFNVIFIAFSAEEKGLLGSNYFVKSQAYPLDKINYMLNLDMIGRIDTAEKILTLIGTATSPLWKDIIDKTKSDYINVKISENATGGSDHASFYVNDIPVIFFFSGLHDDYHKPADVIGKLNFDGIYNTVLYIINLIDNSKSYDKLPYYKAPTEASVSKRNSTVTLGIIPDHAYDGVGLRVSDVTDDKPAAKGGVLKGDIIIKIDDNDIRDIYSYMNALKLYRAGSKARIQLERNKEIIKLDITF